VADARCDIKPWYYPDGPIHGFGYDIEGYVFVSIAENRTMDPEAMDNLYGTLESRGRAMGISNLPVKFISSPLFELDNYPPESRSSRCRPIIGGLMLRTSLTEGTAAAAEVFRLTDTPELDGFPYWSPDGRAIAVSDGDDIFVAAPDDPAVAAPGFGALSAAAALSCGVLAIRVGRPSPATPGD
jgi:hypothetical protein